MIKNHKKSDKRPYESPTTPNLYVTVGDYIIELVCLNTNKKIGARFWSDKKYWGPKYRREVRGIANLKKELDLTDPIIQRALIEIIKTHNIKALVSNKTVAKVVKLTVSLAEDMKDKRLALSKTDTYIEIDEQKNSTFVTQKQKNRLSKIREIEHGKKKT